MSDSPERRHGDAHWSAFDFRKVHIVESTVREI